MLQQPRIRCSPNNAAEHSAKLLVGWYQIFNEFYFFCCCCCIFAILSSIQLVLVVECPATEEQPAEEEPAEDMADEPEDDEPEPAKKKVLEGQYARSKIYQAIVILRWLIQYANDPTTLYCTVDVL